MIPSRRSAISRITLRLLVGTLALGIAYTTVRAEPGLLIDESREEYFTQRIERNPKSAHAFNDRANFYLNCAQFDKAIGDCRQAIQLDSDFAWAYNNRGIAYVGKRDFDRALADYDRATELDPTYTFPYNNRAVIWCELSLYRKAIGECSRALELDPDYAATLVNRGKAYAQIGKLRQAVADLTLALYLDPESGWHRKDLIDTDPERDYVEGSMDEWTAEVREHPERSQAYVKRAVVYLAEYRLREAIGDLRKAQRLTAERARLDKAERPSGIRIISAFYGQNVSWLDVTDKVRQATQAKRNWSVEVQTEDWGEPAPGFGGPRTLLIRYSLNDEVKVKSRYQGKRMTLP